jgi:putative nucleotidyltransferase with HDIG domain
MDSDKLAQTLDGIVVGRIRNGTLVVPSMPDVAARCAALARGADVELPAAAKAIECDPVLAARLLAQANGAGASVAQACARLGAAAVRALLADAAGRQLFQSRDPRIAAAVRHLWEHAVAVALLSRDFAALLGEIDAEAAYLAGLLHDVGKAIGAAMLLELERSSADRLDLTADRWLDAVHAVHRSIAVALAAEWRFPEPLARAIRDPGEFDTSDRRSVGNVVCFANAIAKLQGLYVGTFARDEAEALVMLGRSLLGIDDELVGRLSGALKPRLARETGTAHPG